MKAPQQAINEIKARLATSVIVITVDVVVERAVEDRGYFRARMTLANGDFLEVSEYFLIQDSKPSTVEYRYQWMDRDQQNLIMRWDNAEHYPDLPNFPHHVHVGDEKQVESGQSLSIIELLDIVEHEIGKSLRE